MYITICLRNSRVIIGDGEQRGDEERDCMALLQKHRELLQAETFKRMSNWQYYQQNVLGYKYGTFLHKII